MANPDRGYKDRLVDLRKQFAESIKLGLNDPELYQQQQLQMLNGIEGIKQKSQSEIERLSQMIGEERGRIRACNEMGDLIINIITAFVNQENNRLAEEFRMAAEKSERDELAASMNMKSVDPDDKTAGGQVEQASDSYKPTEKPRRNVK